MSFLEFVDLLHQWIGTISGIGNTHFTLLISDQVHLKIEHPALDHFGRLAYIIGDLLGRAEALGEIVRQVRNISDLAANNLDRFVDWSEHRFLIL